LPDWSRAGIENEIARLHQVRDEAMAFADEQMSSEALYQREDLVSIPGEEVAKVAESPPYARSNSAYINIPGPWEKNQPSIYYISPPNPAWSEQVQADYIAGDSDLLFTSIHEVWPGHFLNFLHANRADFFYGRTFVGYAFAEGWTASRGGRTAWREFHDTFLSYGGPPIPSVRQQMMGETTPAAVFPQN